MGKKLLWIFGAIVLVGVIVGGTYWVGSIQVKKTFLAGKNIMNKGDFQQAAVLFEEVYQKRPGSAEGLEALGNLCQVSLSMEQGEKTLKYAHDLLTRARSDADKARAKFYLGCAYSQLDKLVEAETQLDGLAKQYPQAEFADHALLVLAKVKAKVGQLLESKAILQKIIQRFPKSEMINEVYAELGKTNVKILFSTLPTPNSFQYSVTPGDTVEGIAKKCATTVELIREANGMNVSTTIRKGQTLKIDKSKYSALVSKSKNTLTLFENGEFFKVYSVGTGKSNCTPVGDFKIINKMVNPPWYKPGGKMIQFGDKGNLLGTRWMGINLPGYGIHGTWEPETVGKQSSAGCVRLTNSDVEEFFKIVTVGTPVKIVD